MPDRSIDARRRLIEAFDFRGVHPHVRFGTASDRYAGWIGQIYPESYADEVTSRKRRLDGKTYEERTVPIESAADYFEHFGVLEIDFTYYRPLCDAEGEATSNYGLLRQYAMHAPTEARFFLKVPRTYFSRILRRGGGKNVQYAENPEFLNVDAYLRQFHEPAVEILGDRLVGILFEQEYQRKGESPTPEENVAELDAFFAELPSSVQPHIELRSEHLLAPPYFAWLEDRGIGFVFSHWTWLPPIRKQWRLAGERFTAADGNVVARLLTPINTRYADAYALAHPFDAPVDAISGSEQARNMVMDATALLYQAEKAGVLLNVIVNNRAWGNAPMLAQEIAGRILEFS
jgi:uncharacterized protein YecE (DUF72 family)